MRWGDMRESDNVEDRTGMPGPGGGGGFGFGGMRLGVGSIIVIVIASLLFGINPLEMLGIVGGGGPVTQAPPTAPPPGYGPQTRPPPQAQTQGQKPNESTPASFSKRVLGDTEDVWSAVFQAGGSRYEPPTLVLFERAVASACGNTSAAVGPFYCPLDRKLYLDTSFFQELKQRFGAPGDFAQAYVIAHEVGHHVQNLMGTMRQFDAQSQRADPRTRNDMSVRLELQADCYAGVWTNHAASVPTSSGQPLIEDINQQDIASVLDTASRIGDDFIQSNLGSGRVNSSQFTHGSSQQREKWFTTGYKTGDPAQCDTFARGVNLG